MLVITLGHANKQNDVQTTIIIDVVPTISQQNANVDPANDCYIYAWSFKLGEDGPILSLFRPNNYLKRGLRAKNTIYFYLIDLAIQCWLYFLWLGHKVLKVSVFFFLQNIWMHLSILVGKDLKLDGRPPHCTQRCPVEFKSSFFNGTSSLYCFYFFFTVNIKVF